MSITQMDYQTRWMIRRDMPQVLAIEAASFEFAWTEEDFLNCLRDRSNIGMVCEVEFSIVGFVIYTLDRKSLQVLNFAVAPTWRRRGVGTAMFRRLVGKLPHGRPRNQIRCEVRETNDVAIRFFRSMGMTATSVLREHYVDTDEDAYLFRLEVQG